ncbi:MAG TPA: phosphodiester glycosidase family protein [Methylomirabilota bacterium]|nr:phosphodiester glycosidase family protein [Methylomirabilota bacterium]
MSKLRRQAGWLVLLLWFCSQGQGQESARSGRGLAYHRDELLEGPWVIQVVKIDRKNKGVELQTTLGGGNHLGIAPLSDQMKAFPRAQGRPIAAINGDYYRDEGPYTGDPKGLQIRNGELISAPCDWTALWVDADGNPHMTNVSSRFEARWGGESKISIGLNQERVASAAVLYTPAMGQTTKTKGGMEFILEPASTNALLKVGEEHQARVREIRDTGNSSIRTNTWVLSIGAQSPPTALPKVGGIVTISTETGPNIRGAKAAMGGGPALVRSGKVVPYREVAVRNPRSAVGWNKDHIFLVQVDGRRLNVSVGMTTAELSAYLQKIGCEEAMSLDGGGSSTCWVYGQVMNNPSEGFERSMANALVAVQKPK